MILHKFMGISKRISHNEFLEIPFCLDKGNLIKKETQEDIFYV